MRQLTTSWPTILFLLLFLCGQVFVDVVLRQGQGVVHFASHNLSVSRFHGLWDHSHSHVFHGFNSVCSHLHNFFHLYTKSQSRTFIDIIFVVDEYWYIQLPIYNIPVLTIVKFILSLYSFWQIFLYLTVGLFVCRQYLFLSLVVLVGTVLLHCIHAVHGRL